MAHPRRGPFVDPILHSNFTPISRLIYAFNKRALKLIENETQELFGTNYEPFHKMNALLKLDFASVFNICA
jgi:hypothetical protein